MYAPHQNATVVPLDIETSTREVRGNRTVPTVSATASVKDGEMNITLSNIDLAKATEVSIPLGVKAKLESGEILTADNISDYNDFGVEEKVTLKPFKGAKLSKDKLTLSVPAKSVVNLRLKL